MGVQITDPIAIAAGLLRALESRWSAGKGQLVVDS